MPYTHLHPTGRCIWKHNFFVQVWTFHLIPSKRFLWKCVPKPMHHFLHRSGNIIQFLAKVFWYLTSPPIPIEGELEMCFCAELDRQIIEFLAKDITFWKLTSSPTHSKRFWVPCMIFLCRSGYFMYFQQKLLWYPRFCVQTWTFHAHFIKIFLVKWPLTPSPWEWRFLNLSSLQRLTFNAISLKDIFVNWALTSLVERKITYYS